MNDENYSYDNISASDNGEIIIYTAQSISGINENNNDDDVNVVSYKSSDTNREGEHELKDFMIRLDSLEDKDEDNEAYVLH